MLRRRKQKDAAQAAGSDTEPQDSDALCVPGLEDEVTVGVDDFELVKVIGKGSFGKVMQVRKRDSGEIYAMKVLKKAELVKRKQVQHTMSERSILAKIDFPFIVSLRYAFQTEAKLYMVLDFFNGGELFFHLKNEGRFEEERARFYGAELVLSLEELHKRNIIYRDMKPENILLDMDGHIRVTDFGLSKDDLRPDSLTHTFCGTPEYLAPEILQGSGHGHAVDWWSFGTLLYEMMTGLPPFYNDNLNIMYDRILHGRVSYPSFLSPQAVSLFNGLLQRDPAKRLGSGPTDAEELKAHPFFEDIDWDALVRKTIQPPFKPAVHDPESTDLVDAEFTAERPKDTPVQNTGSVLTAAEAFPGFTYVGEEADMPMGGA